jgi:hypothetical protein
MPFDAPTAEHIPLAERLKRAKVRLRRLTWLLEGLVMLEIWGTYLLIRLIVPRPPASQHIGDPIVVASFVVLFATVWWFRKQRQAIFRSEGACCPKCRKPLSSVALRAGRCIGCNAPLAIGE